MPKVTNIFTGFSTVCGDTMAEKKIPASLRSASTFVIPSTKRWSICSISKAAARHNFLLMQSFTTSTAQKLQNSIYQLFQTRNF